MDDLLEVLTVDQLRARASVRWSHYPHDVLPLWVAEMDVPVAEPVREAVRALLDAHDVGYPPEDGALTAAFTGFAMRRWGWTVDATAVRQLTDVMTAVQTAVAAVTPPGGVVIVPTPVYGPFRWYTEGSGRRVETVLLREGRLDVDAIDATAARVRAEVGPGEGIALLLCNPHNPTGVVHTRAELAALADVAARHDVRVVSDEAHAPLVLPGSPAYVPYLEVDPRGLAVHSAAKTWNLAGFKSALLVAGDEARDVLGRVPTHLGDAVGHVSMVAHAAAYRDGGAWLDELLPALARRRDLFVGLVGEHLPGARVRVPEATYLGWVDLRAAGPDGAGLGDDPAHAFLKEGRVALGRGLDFGPGGEGHVRVNCATRVDVLTEAFERMGEVAAAHRA
ncbi:cystathionine beta-lyase [Flavimobilis soli]|uniref:cysteine-S-conjugate beta-lyase n=1 Tax=Flavimobilis soli TaxID=442709 RepID=A0A2A9EEM3_9MICO|nr:aminotransferase class I/II-fold pyridoxal phosphate-dependent enzyme [Flavimobilis soli]PFG37001.1 cystathionine beta-lyase [Flavimobilis soli]